MPKLITEQDFVFKDTVHLVIANGQKDRDSVEQGKEVFNVVLHMSSVQDVGSARDTVDDGTFNELRVEHSPSDPEGDELRPLGEERSCNADTA